MKDCIVKLSTKAADAPTADAAMKFSQAANNVANVLCALRHAEREERKTDN